MNESLIFTNVLKLATPAERAAYLDEICAGHPQLRADVEALLRAHASDPGFLEQPAALPSPPGGRGVGGEGSATTATFEPPDAAAGMVIAGKYKLLELIGEGGMGTVWMAEQTEPVKRLVALKLIKPGMDSRQVIARFEAERQALALMDHPNIAKVLDAGTTGSRQGDTETRRQGEKTGDVPSSPCLPVSLSSSGRPYFVMELVKGVPITKYCDEHRLTPRQRLELFVPVCHAIQHAHQKGIIHRDLKPSNVLIAPYDDRPVPKVIDFGVAKATGQQLTEETLHTGFGAVVGTLEYMSPEQAGFNQLDIDTRSDIYSLGVLLYELLAGSPPFSRKDLETAGMLEMLRVIREQEPSKPSTKLSTAEGLPTLAANRGTEPAKLTKLVRGELDWIVMKALEKDRNRRYETANGFAMDVQRYLADEAVAACPPSVLYRFRKFARRNKAALTTAALVLGTVVTGLTISTIMIARERDKAQGAAREAEDQRAEAVRQSTLAGINAEEADKERRRAETNLQRTREAVDRFFTRAAEDMAGKPHMEKVRRALLEDALKFYQGFLEQKGNDAVIRHETARAFVRVAQVQQWLGNTAHVEAPARSAIALFKQLSMEHSASKEYRQDLAEAHQALASSLNYQTRLEEALTEHRKGLAVWEQLAADFPAVVNYRQRVASGHCNLGVVLFRLFRYEEAEKEFRCAQALCDQIHREFPSEPEDRGTMSRYWVGLGELFVHWNRWHEAEQPFREAVRLAGEDPTTYARTQLAGVLVKAGKPQEAERLYRQALAGTEKLADDFPSVPAYRFTLWIIHCCGLPDALVAMDRMQEAIEAQQRGVTILGKLLADHPSEMKFIVDLGASYSGLGYMLYAANRSREAVDAFRQAQELYEKAAAEMSQGPHGLLNLAELLANCPAPHFRDPPRAVQLARRAVQKWPSWVGWSSLGSALYRAGQWNEAIEALNKAMELGNGGSALDWFFLAMAHWQRGDPKEARIWYDKAVAGMQKYPSWPIEDHLCRDEAAALLGLPQQSKQKEKVEPGRKR